jgi:hypothetical protein
MLRKHRMLALIIETKNNKKSNNKNSSTKTTQAYDGPLMLICLLLNKILAVNYWTKIKV